MKEPKMNSGEIFIAAVLTGCLLFCAALLAYGVATGDVPKGTEPSLTDWIEALSTLVAFLAAAVAVWVASGALRLEQARDRHRDDRERRAQAELVAAWADATYKHDLATQTTATDDGSETSWHAEVVIEQVRVTIRNASLLPVNSFWLHFYILGSDESRDDEPEFLGNVWVGRVLPEATVGPFDALSELQTSRIVQVASRRRNPYAPVDLSVGWSFRDNANEQWFRPPRATLKPGVGPDDPDFSNPLKSQRY